MKETRGVGIHAYLLVGLACQLRVTSLDPQVRCLLLGVVDQKLLLEVELTQLFDVLLILFFAPMTWIGDSCLKLRYCVVEICR